MAETWASAAGPGDLVRALVIARIEEAVSTISSTMFGPAPSIAVSLDMQVGAADAVPADAQILGVFVAATGAVDDRLGVDRAHLDAMGFTAAIGEAVIVGVDGGAPRVAIGLGDPGNADATTLRDAGAAFGRATGRRERIAVATPAGTSVDAAGAAQAIVEGIVLSRYRYDALRSDPKGTAIEAITVVAPPSELATADAGAHQGRVRSAATKLSRDLANSPHSHLTATILGDLAAAIGPSRGLTVEVFGKDEVVEMGLGGLLGVNAGSAEPPRLIKMSYIPEGEATGHLGIVGKALMYDSGGLSLKPGDEVHAQMKNDMTGGASTFAAMCVLGAAGCRARVTAWLMATDNMPSGTAMALGDVLTIRNGTTIEVINTDAEGRLVLADGLVLAVEEGCDAIVNIATLTGACMRALGTSIAGVMGNNGDLVDQVRRAGAAVGEPLWELPLVDAYRKDIESPIADLRNLGTTPNGGAIHAALFLEPFVAGKPWAHIDIAGVAQTPADRLWHTAGCSGWGARTLVQLAVDFATPADVGPNR
jgi:leucyl aminopeptidase